MSHVSRILVVGKNSFIGSHFAYSYNNVDIISHTEIDSVDFCNYKTVLNCSITPEYRTHPYDEKFDMDFLVAQKAQKSNSHYVMISTRKVYGVSNELQSYTETSEINPVDNYSENKFITEEKVRANLAHYTILRGSNIFGNEYGRKTFMGFCLTQLKDTNKIIFTLSGDIKRDFIHIDDVSVVLKKVCEICRSGTYNMSSNYPMTISEIPKFLIKGYGMGYFHSDGPILDQFVLNNYSLVRNFDLMIRKDYRYILKAIGERLCVI